MHRAINIIALSKIKGLGSKTLFNIVQSGIDLSDATDAYAMFEMVCHKYKRIQRISKDEFDKNVDVAAELLNKQKELGIDIVCMSDAEYPHNFYALETPPVYFVAKGNINALKQNNIAIIGTRETSDFSMRVGEHLGKYIASKNWAITSGLAEGCDTAGHVGCLQAKGIAIAIVATSLDTVYPKSNEKLQEEILSNNGCVISEYLIGAKITPYNFVARDRLQYGLANGIVVAETGLKGGTWHAINGAINLKKPIACYNYKDEYYLQHEKSLGNQKMIKDNVAMPLYSAMSIDSFLNKCSNKDAKSVQEISLF